MNNNYRDPAAGLGPLLFGFAAGVIGTIVYAAMRPREFDRVVNKTRDIQGRGHDLMDDIGEKTHDMMDRARNTSKRAIHEAERAAHHALGKLDDGVRETSANLQNMPPKS